MKETTWQQDAAKVLNVLAEHDSKPPAKRSGALQGCVPSATGSADARASDEAGADSLARSADSAVRRVFPHDLMQQGGEWLAAARRWLQWHTKNGEHVHWGSHDEIQPTMTVKMVEELAADVAAAAINAERDEVRKNATALPCNGERARQPNDPGEPRAR
jgi:hypothetical protein